MTKVGGVDYPDDPNNVGWVLGWGVFRRSPWHFVGLVYPRGNALAHAKELGEGYEAAYGSHQIGTDNFMFDDKK